MPLHLLGKKSWNVYNADNIARVRRDEADARAREEAEEQRMQEEDSARRIAILRGEEPPPLAIPPARDEDDGAGQNERPKYGERRQRKRAGEDDTDFEMRIAAERAAQGARAARELAGGHDLAARRNDAPITNEAGNISLFSEADERAASYGEKNEEAEREAAKKRREMEDQYQMRFVNAAGRDGAGLTDGGPWYAKGDDQGTAPADPPSLNAFGREDPGRKVRDATRLNLNDPLAAMKQGAAMARSVGIARKKEREERERDLKALRKEEKEARRRERERRREYQRRSGRSRSRSPERHSKSSYRHRDADKGEGRDRDRDRDRGRNKDRDRRSRSRERVEEKYHVRRHGEEDERRGTSRHRLSERER
ncbi:hypothetical protein GQ53DRAFT_423841 [Thozetella sp. PMI_491]|nr:hypothetical protein GQ53DRAFT_423841 [Thozetella sp. PMI_491]